MKIFRHILAIALLYPIFLPVHAAVEVYPMMSTISAGDNGMGELKILSRSSVVQYIEVSTLRVTHPGTDHEKNVPSTPTDEPTLIASPERLILEPHQVHVVRLIANGTAAKETLYRVAIKPVSAPTAVAEQAASDVSTNIGLSIVWAPLVTVEPKVSMPAWSINIKHGIFTNTGNVHLSVERVAYCTSPTDTKNCQWKPINHIVYAGEDMPIPNAPNKTLTTFRIEYKTPDGQVHTEARAMQP
jgi:P pilus assembly chaperone PapD